ncbi:hypothetical protein C5748_07360 [Phyllobacterium phragmitis]|uniref:Uncharacterized protein n=1 Tax=Phyllobacterium phragmitis TaxID=2670329 RepID=A0A2S9IV47_9HYPH|nr:hypothetical protein [Phyllobacterium phragmitis]PRD44388.1 hypothetical protein C5748_07360 [Phyllobacterium phragmitis]
MDRFWERSPEWLRERELQVAFEAARDAKERAGRQVLLCVELGELTGPVWKRDRTDYIAAVEAYEAAFDDWDAAEKAFQASPAGQAYHRWLYRRAADPIAREAAATPEEIAA